MKISKLIKSWKTASYSTFSEQSVLIQMSSQKTTSKTYIWGAAICRFASNICQHDQLTSRWRHSSICKAYISKLLFCWCMARADLKCKSSIVEFSLTGASKISFWDVFAIEKHQFRRRAPTDLKTRVSRLWPSLSLSSIASRPFG